ncbi:hypothetical protein B2A_05490, partial [mine drainage metagenome]
MSENAVTVALRALGYDGDTMTAHGFRSTASTLLHEQGYPSDVIERQLRPQGKQRGQGRLQPRGASARTQGHDAGVERL